MYFFLFVPTLWYILAMKQTQLREPIESDAANESAQFVFIEPEATRFELFRRVNSIVPVFVVPLLQDNRL